MQLEATQKPTTTESDSLWGRIRPHLRWTRSSSILLGTFLMTIGLIVVIWWQLAADLLALIDWGGAWWRSMDWLLVGIFAVMTVLLVIGADIRKDALIIFVGSAGGLVIESWGTQTHLWTYYTFERPPLWIIPAWPIAALSIDRLVRFLRLAVEDRGGRAFDVIYWLIFPAFYALMIFFVAPTVTKPMTIAAMVLCAFLIIFPQDRRLTVLTFAAGAGLGYFLELWGTTRLCWMYYTKQMPPLFAVLAHGMAAVAFWRVMELIRTMYPVMPILRPVRAVADRVLGSLAYS
jgi:hypothetical protein